MGEPSINGRAPDGTFAAGNSGGPGNPHNGPSQKFRSLVYSCTSEEEFRDAWKWLFEEVKARKSWAFREFFDRLLGKPKQGVELENLPELLTETIRLINGPAPRGGASAGDDASAK